MACPVHIWAPLAAAAVPVAHLVRDHLMGLDLRAKRRAKKERKQQAAAERRMKRWAPVGAQAAEDAPRKG